MAVHPRSDDNPLPVANTGEARENQPVEENAAGPGPGRARCRSSLVVASRDRAPQLRETLARLAGLEASLPWEVVLVDNGSTDDTLRVMRSFERQAPVPVRVVEERTPGWGAAKNTGVRASRGKIVVSIDDDCYPAPDYLDAVSEAFEDPDVGYIGGRILLDDPTDRPVTINTLSEPRTLPPRSHVPAGLIQGANMAFRREVFDRIGGFDELFGAGAAFSGGDVEFAARASARGWKGAYVPEALVYHAHGRKTEEAARRLLRWYDRGRGAYYVKMILDSPLRAEYLKRWWWSSDRRRAWQLLRELRGGVAYLARRVALPRARRQPRIDVP